MTKPRPNKWERPLTLISTGLAVILAAMHIIGLPSCDDYVKKAEAAEVHNRLDKTDKELQKEQTEVIKLLHRILGKLDAK